MNWIRSRPLTILCSFALGGFFLYACYHKIIDPPDFAKSVNNYKILASRYVNSVAIYMPWLELLSGVALVTGIGRRGAALLSGGLLVMFIAAIAFNLYRGHPTICGCTLTYEESLKFTDEEKFAQMRNVIYRDIGLSLLAAQVFFARCCPARD